MTGDLFVIINPVAVGQLVKQLAIDPKFKGSNPASISTKREWNNKIIYSENVLFFTKTF